MNFTIILLLQAKELARKLENKKSKAAYCTLNIMEHFNIKCFTVLLRWLKLWRTPPLWDSAKLRKDAELPRLTSYNDCS